MSPGPRSPKRRWHRLVIPYAVTLAVMVGSAVAYNWHEPNPTDPAYLSPTSDDDIGGRSLARMLTERGVRIDRQSHTSDALVEAGRSSSANPTTLFIPAPALVHPFYLRMIKFLPASTAVVIVSPDAKLLRLARLPAGVIGTRLAALAAAPACDYAPALRAGTASVLRTRYTGRHELASCYDGGLTVVRRGEAEVTLVGANDPFRNDRIDEHHNAALATELLAGAGRVIWLDLHREEKRPGYVDNPALASQAPAPPSLGPGSPDPDFPLPDGPVAHTISPPEGGQDPIVAGPSNPLWQAFPPWVFAAVALLGLATVLLALARGRRLGGPVHEPLPVTVRATETVQGRGRLYQRARAPGHSATILRDQARHRLRHLLDLPGAASPAAVAEATAAASGWPPDQVTEVLFGGEPADDSALVRVAAGLERLLRDVTRQVPGPGAQEEHRHEGDPR
ncbi:MAG: DUF4350 domain-containing protein [Dactylosporangium sp.]|nr:DUF4350 domain-containing protein [Dactylosporangium sp.]NNJ60134.1 DUF4350 domain-containing protein [Dactylosporangium sp.]